MLVDTDVLIWYMRGNKNALKAIEKTSNFHISVITYMELVQCMRNKTELNALRKSLRDWNVSISYIYEEISAKAMFYVEQHYLSQYFKFTGKRTCMPTGRHVCTVLCNVGGRASSHNALSCFIHSV